MSPEERATVLYFLATWQSNLTTALNPQRPDTLDQLQFKADLVNRQITILQNYLRNGKAGGYEPQRKAATEES